MSQKPFGDDVWCERVTRAYLLRPARPRRGSRTGRKGGVHLAGGVAGVAALAGAPGSTIPGRPGATGVALAVGAAGAAPGCHGLGRFARGVDLRLDLLNFLLGVLEDLIRPVIGELLEFVFLRDRDRALVLLVGLSLAELLGDLLIILDRGIGRGGLPDELKQKIGSDERGKFSSYRWDCYPACRASFPAYPASSTTSSTPTWRRRPTPPGCSSSSSSCSCPSCRRRRHRRRRLRGRWREGGAERPARVRCRSSPGPRSMPYRRSSQARATWWTPNWRRLGELKYGITFS